MIKIIKNGREKTFIARCMDCVSDFSYTWEDVSEVEIQGMTLPFLKKQRFVTCPVCGEQVPVGMLTPEEWDRNGAVVTGFHA